MAGDANQTTPTGFGPFALDAAVVAAAPALGYAAAYFYEVGFSQHFNIPANLISIGLEEIFVAVTGLVVAGAVVYSVANLVSMFIQ